jgi:hypothetical protein
MQGTPLRAFLNINPKFQAYNIYEVWSTNKNDYIYCITVLHVMKVN